MRRSMRSPSAPFATLIQYLNAPLTTTKNRNTPERPNSSPRRPTWKPSKMCTGPAPEPARQIERQGRKGAVGLTPLEGLALDGLVHDPARQIEGREVERQGSQDDSANDELVPPGMMPNIAE